MLTCFVIIELNNLGIASRRFAQTIKYGTAVIKCSS